MFSSIVLPAWGKSAWGKLDCSVSPDDVSNVLAPTKADDIHNLLVFFKYILLLSVSMLIFFFNHTYILFVDWLFSVSVIKLKCL